jgi:hypothetical protein
MAYLQRKAKRLGSTLSIPESTVAVSQNATGDRGSRSMVRVKMSGRA